MCRYVSAKQVPRTPLSMDVADLNGDGVLEFVVSFNGSIRWYVAPEGEVTGTWAELPVFDDADAATTIRSIHIVDVDGDGQNDIMATVDRPGTIKDSLVWFRNVGR